jgi:hypothetical protein
MSDQRPDDELDSEEFGGLSIEDDPDGTVDPGELQGTADDGDDDVLHADYTEEDLED